MFKEIFYDWGGINTWLFHAINDLHNQILDRLMLLGTQIGSHTLFPFYITLIVLVATLWTNRTAALDIGNGQKLAMRWLVTLSIFCVAYVLDGVFLMWAKHYFDYPRPPLALPPGSVHIVGEAEYHQSLPSGHASFAMLVVASLWPMFNRWQKWAAVAFVAWVGMSRIVVGAHFPADILAGWLTALSIVLLSRAIAIRFLTRLHETTGENDA